MPETTRGWTDDLTIAVGEVKIKNLRELTLSKTN